MITYKFKPINVYIYIYILILINIYITKKHVCW